MAGAASDQLPRWPGKAMRRVCDARFDISVDRFFELVWQPGSKFTVRDSSHTPILPHVIHQRTLLHTRRMPGLKSPIYPLTKMMRVTPYAWAASLKADSCTCAAQV